jgi:hypothetical protein
MFFSALKVAETLSQSHLDKARILSANKRRREPQSISILPAVITNRWVLDLPAPGRSSKPHVKQALRGNHFLKVPA